MRNSIFGLLGLIGLSCAPVALAQSTEYWDRARAQQARQRSSTSYWERAKAQQARQRPTYYRQETLRQAQNRTYRQYQGALNASRPPVSQGPSSGERTSRNAGRATRVFQPRNRVEQFDRGLTQEFRQEYRLRDDYTVRRTPSGRINIYDRTNRLTHYARPSLDGGYRVYDRSGQFQRRITPSLADSRD